MKTPKNIETNRKTLAKLILADIPLKELKQRVLLQIINSYKNSTANFIKDYNNYFEETGGHCPFGINSD